MSTVELSAGVSRRIITPPKGIFLIGYGDRVKGNTGVHDDLTATALVLDDGKTRLAIVALDMLVINEFIADRVRVKVGKPTEVLLCCSHTHSGPIAYADGKSRRLNRNYIDLLVGRIREVVNEAALNLTPARLEWSQGEADIAINRRERKPDGHMEIGRNPAGVVDRSVNLVNILTADGTRLATLINYPCHGTVLGPDNLLASADWIGAMRNKVEKELGGLGLFLQGATGNLNPDMYWNHARAYEMMHEEGERVADAVIRAAGQKAEPFQVMPLRVQRAEAWIPFETPIKTLNPPKSYHKPLLAMAGLPAWMGFLTDLLLAWRYPWKSRIEAREGRWAVPMRINAVRVGELGLVTFGAEVFTEIGMKVKEKSPARHTLFASVTDGCIGYLPTADAHSEGGYEVDVVPYIYRYPGKLSPESERIALETAYEALTELWEQ